MDISISSRFPCAQHSLEREDGFNLMEFRWDSSSRSAILRLIQSSFPFSFFSPSVASSIITLTLPLFPLLSCHSFSLLPSVSSSFLLFLPEGYQVILSTVYRLVLCTFPPLASTGLPSSLLPSFPSPWLNQFWDLFCIQGKSEAALNLTLLSAQQSIL